MNKNVFQTKKNLTIIFTMIVFFVILLFGTSFFTFKYFNDIRIEKQGFISVVNNLESGNLSIEKFIKSSVGFQEPKIMEFKKYLDKNSFKNNLNPRGFMNHILIQNNEVISNNIKDNIDENLLLKILNNDKIKFYQEGGFLIKKLYSENKTLILFKKVRYSFTDYSYDLLLFILVNICFSVLFYIIGYKFVNKTFIPVEENMKDMNDFVQNAGHEFKTPLSVIDSNIQLIKETKDYNPEMLDEIKEEGLKLNSLIDALIKLTNIDTIHASENINLENTIQELISNFKTEIHNKKLGININIDQNISVKCDKNYLYIVLSNIIGNAIKYNEKKGNIDITYKNDSLIITDTGIGISQSDQDKIFNRFYKVDSSRNSQGFGIGLSLVMKIVNIYNWKISVKSEIGKGSSFILNFKV